MYTDVGVFLCRSTIASDNGNRSTQIVLKFVPIGKPRKAPLHISSKASAELTPHRWSYNLRIPVRPAGIYTPILGSFDLWGNIPRIGLYYSCNTKTAWQDPRTNSSPKQCNLAASILSAPQLQFPPPVLSPRLPSVLYSATVNYNKFTLQIFLNVSNLPLFWYDSSSRSQRQYPSTSLLTRSKAQPGKSEPPGWSEWNDSRIRLQVDAIFLHQYSVYPCCSDHNLRIWTRCSD